MTEIKYAQIHFVTEAFCDDLGQDDLFSLAFRSDQGGCSAILDRAKLQQLQAQIAFALSAQSHEPKQG